MPYKTPNAENGTPPTAHKTTQFLSPTAQNSTPILGVHTRVSTRKPMIKPIGVHGGILADVCLFPGMGNLLVLNTANQYKYLHVLPSDVPFVLLEGELHEAGGPFGMLLDTSVEIVGTANVHAWATEKAHKQHVDGV